MHIDIMSIYHYIYFSKGYNEKHLTYHNAQLKFMLN